MYEADLENGQLEMKFMFFGGQFNSSSNTSLQVTGTAPKLLLNSTESPGSLIYYGKPLEWTLQCKIAFCCHSFR